MKKPVAAIAIALGILSTGPALAAESSAEALARSKACMACHAIGKKMVGPSYRDVANKYRGQADALAKLSEKVKKGGSGVWGPIAMPPNPAVKDEEIKTIVSWILSLK